MVDTKVKVNVPGLSSFDKSFKNIFTTKVGTLTPMVNKLLIPGSRGRLKIALSAALPPLASDCFMRCDFKVEAFMVPLRLLYGGFESWLTGKKLHDYTNLTDTVAELPRIQLLPLSLGQTYTEFNAGTLFDYLGMRCDPYEVITSQAGAWLNIFPALCYHRIYDDWYRSARIQTPVFAPPVALNMGITKPLSALPYIAEDYIVNFAPSDTFNDGVKLSDLRQRNWGDDYFTIAAASAQVGTEQSVSTVGNVFTIGALRGANSLQQFAERSNLASPRLQDYVRAHYGADLSGGVAQRSILLGSASYPVYSKGVESTAQPRTTSMAPSNNPFESVGARYGSAFASGTDFVCDFECNEPSILMVIGSLVPEANYSSGIDKWCSLLASPGSQVDIPDPLLENIGNEPIGSNELTGSFPVSGSQGVVFGWVPRNTWFKTSQNQVHGLLRDGHLLSSFIPHRDFSGVGFTISSAFLEIPTSALDNVTVVTGDLSRYGCWVDSFIDFKVSEPLVESAMPSLQDPAYEHGHGVTIDFNGGHI